MSIDAKGIQLLVWRIVRFSGIGCYKFVRKYPLVSGILVFVFFLYTFCTPVFYFLIYSSPVLVCTAVAVWFYLKTKYPGFRRTNKKEDSDNKRSSSAKVNRLHDPALRPQKSVRRNARKEVLEWDRKDIEDRGMLFKRGPYYDTLFNKTSFLEENPKLAFDGKASSSMEHGESSSNIGPSSISDNETSKPQRSSSNIGPNSISDNETLKPHSVSRASFEGRPGKAADGGCEVEVESLEDGEDEEDDGKKAVEWTVDDQKNLMDLGLLELERNKRLESLIAKRRARKLFRMAVEKSMNMERDSNNPRSQIAPILIVRNNLLGVTHNPNAEDLQMPGSAPSVLLPAQNPFDLPYDPLEEKPNLMADSFHQEFMAANQKDMFLCRHESFCRGPVFMLETTQDLQDAQFDPYRSSEKRLVEAAAVSRFQRLTDKGGHCRQDSSGIGRNADPVELADSNHNEEINSSEVRNEESRESASEIGDKMKNSDGLEPGSESRSEVRIETDSIKNNDSSCSSSSEATDELNTVQTNKSSGQILNEHMRKNFNLRIPPKAKTVNRLPYDSSPSPSDRRRADFLFYGYRRHGHTPTCSIASDLQVEVSEIGSPPTTDGTVSPVDGDSVTYDGDVDRDANSDNDELWGGSFNLTRDAARTKQIGLQDITEEDSAEAELSGLGRKPEERIPSPSPSEQEAKQTLNNTSSLSSRMDITENDASHPANIESETHKDVEQINTEADKFQTSNVSDTSSPENPRKTMHLMEKSAVHLPSESCIEKPEQSIKPQDTPTEDLSIVANMKPVTLGDTNTLDSKSFENIEDEARKSIQPSALGETADDVKLDSSEYRHGNLETSYESKSTMEAEKEMKESQSSKHIEEDTQNLSDNTRDAPNAVQTIDASESVPDHIDGQNVSDDNLSGVKEIIGGSIALALNRRLALAQISLSSCSSPRSVLSQNILADRLPISDVGQQIQTDVPQSTTEDIGGDDSADDQPHENLTDNMSQNAQQLIENSMDHQSSNCSPDAFQGSSEMTEKNTDYNTTHKDFSIKPIEGEPKTLMSYKDGKELPQPSRESNPSSILHLEGGSDKVIERDSGIDPSKSEEENAKSDFPETTVREEIPTHSPSKVIEQGNNVENINNAEVNEKDRGRKLTTNEGESQQEAIGGPKKSNDQDADVNKTVANERDNTSIPETAAKAENSVAEVSIIRDVNYSSTNNTTEKGILNLVIDGEGEPQMLSREEDALVPPKTTGETSAGSVANTEHESKELANAGQLTSAGPDSNSLDNNQNGKDIQKSNSQEDDLDAPKPGEDNLKASENISGVGDITRRLSIDHEIPVEESKPSYESALKAVGPEENDSNLVSN